MPPDRLKALQDRTRYEPAEVESRVFARWEEAGVFSPDPEGSAEENFSIAVPPPNVTGALHMGHALNASIQDLCIRHARMQGRRAKWIFGTDHAGIGTQVKVEQALEEEGTSREEIGREAFITRVWEWRREHGSTIVEQFRRIGASLDYADERFTMDEQYALAVQLVFVRLYEKGLIYRDNYMVNWDPGTRSAISDLEVEQRHVEDTLYMVDYPLESGSGSITVATVRPETMLADTAIAVHPDDERYTRLIGEAAILPLVGRRLPIIADEYVKTDFGTGALKITPGHDPNDFEIGRKHGLEEISVIGEDGLMTADGYEGLTAEAGREKVVAALRAEGSISGTQPYGHDVPHSHRSGARIEPLISLQWFCDMEKLAGPAIAAAKDGSLRFHPERPWTGVYLDWLENIRPWCVSRQLWWGHQIPVWYRGEETHCGMEPPEGDGWERDPDVLDTWFSSALWPFATLGWPNESPALRAFYPTDVLSTARDIIFLWVARMVMFGVEFTGELPFTDVPIHSVIQAPDGRRMSKSLGTGIDPLDEIDRHGADALRFGLLAMSSTQDVRFSEERVRQGRDLANKLWNASRLILLGVQEGVEPSAERAETVEDRWILSRMERITARTEELVEGFELAPAALELYEFFWSELCDWYLELAKPRLYDEAADRTAVSATLLFCLDRVLRLLHPVMPHVTEEVWSFMPGERGLLADAEWPAAGALATDAEAEAELGRAIEAITELRRYREQAGVKPSAILPARLSADGYEATAGQVARLARLEFSDNGDAAAEVPVPGGTVALLPTDAFDPGEAERKIAARRDELEAEIGRLEKKLANERFVQKAPAEVVEGEREKLDGYRSALEKLEMTFREAEAYLLDLELFGMKFGLERMHRLMTALGLPQRRFASIHVVGSNGKSSTVRFIAAILQREGLRTGSYTSPHLASFRERIEVGEEAVSEERFAAAVERTVGLVEDVTQFEAMTAAAYHELASREVEIAVIEAGLGGRYDATNVIPSKLTVLTGVGLEHTRWLGPTIPDIAAEKLDVVRDHSILVLPSDLDPEALEVAERVAGERHARLVTAPVPEGSFQRRNFSLAYVAAAEFLGRAPGSEAVEAAIRETRIPGRLEVVADGPLTVHDGAHNPAGAEALARALPELVGERRPVVLVASVLDDKDAAGMLGALLPAFDRAVFTRCANPRALSPGTLDSLAAKLGGPPSETVAGAQAAVARAREIAGPGGAVVVTGSIYLIADLVRGEGAPASRL